MASSFPLQLNVSAGDGYRCLQPVFTSIRSSLPEVEAELGSGKRALYTLPMLLLQIFVLGMTAGLRSLTPPAVLSWASQQRQTLSQSWLGFMTSPVTAYILTALALVELVTDKLPFTASRLTPGPFIARMLSGGLCGATLAAGSQQSVVLGVLVGVLGAIAGSFAGYHARHALVSKLRVPDFPIAIVEDVIAIGASILVTHI